MSRFAILFCITNHYNVQSAESQSALVLLLVLRILCVFVCQRHFASSRQIDSYM